MILFSEVEARHIFLIFQRFLNWFYDCVRKLLMTKWVKTFVKLSKEKQEKAKKKQLAAKLHLVEKFYYSNNRLEKT